MRPVEIGFEDCDKPSLIEDIFDKQTQTSNSSIADSTNTSANSPPSQTPSSSGIIDTTSSGSVKVFEFCQVIREPDNPNSITILKESFVKEIRDHSEDTDDAIANRFKYCREVIKPYVKYPKDCPDTEEQLIKDALESAYEDFPDYQPCYQSDNKDKVKEKKPSKNSISIMDADKACPQKERKENECPPKNDPCKPKCPSKDEKPTCISKQDDPPKSPCPVKPECSPKPEPPPPSKGTYKETQKKDSCKEPSKPYPEDPCNPQPKQGNSKCPKESKPCDSKPNSHSCSMSEPVIGIKPSQNPEQKSSFFLTDKSKVCKPSPSTPNQTEEKPNEKSMIDAHCETIATIKVAVEDFFGKVYQNTKNAVTLITTESAKHLGLKSPMKSESCSTEDVMKKNKAKSNENKSAETLLSFNLFKLHSQDKKDESTEVSKKDGINSEEIINKIVEKVDSLTSILSEHINMDKINDIMKFKFDLNDQSSPYDTPSKPPKEVSHLHEPAATSQSVFSTIKSKIFSMFTEGEADMRTSLSNSSIHNPLSHTDSSGSDLSSTTLKENSDEDLINRFIE